MAQGAVYVYGVLAASDDGPASVAGVEEANVRTVDHDDLAALVSDLGSDKLAAAREVRAHWRVLEAASKRATVLPVRFGTVMESEQAVRDQLLEPNADRLGVQLRELRDRVQLIVKGDYDEERLLKDIVRDAPAVAQLRERVRTLPDAAGYYERIRLGELVAGELARRREQDSGLALERLGPLAVDSRVEQPSGQSGAFNLAFLVDRAQTDRFSRGVRGLGDELGERVSLRYVGPLPPYSFAEPGEAQWD